METKLCQSGGCGASKTVAFESGATVSSLASELVVLVCAPCSGPDAARPVCSWGGEGSVGVGVKGEPTLFEDGMASVRLDRGPDSEWAVVYDCEDHVGRSEWEKD